MHQGPLISNQEGHTKVHVRLVKDQDGYPSDDWESLWAREVEPGVYLIDNVPFFARGISCGDLVSATDEGEGLVFGHVITPSRNSVIRVIVFEKEATAGLREELRKMGCESELCDIPGFFSLEIPGTVNAGPVRKFLDAKETSGVLEYEEASIRH